MNNYKYKIKTMNTIVKVFFLIIVFSSAANNGNAQDITFEQVKNICNDNTAQNQKMRVVVSKFTSRMYAHDYNQLGTELATMLQNALFEVNCFNVLSSASSMDEFDAEYELTNSGYTNNSGSQKGGMLGAQFVITGEITEYGEGKKSVKALGFDVGANKANVGFVLTVRNLASRQIVFSKAVNMEGKSNGFNGVRLLGLQVAGSENRSKALNDAVEKAIIKATELLATTKDEWGVAPDPTMEGMNQLIVSIDGIDFTSLMSFQTKLNSTSGVKKAEMNMKDGIGYLNVITSMSNQELAVKLNGLNAGYEISGLDNGGVQMRKK